MSGEPIMTLDICTRGYELNARGDISAGTWLRYLEHHRWQTFSTDAIIPIRRFWDTGVVRAQALELFGAVSFHEALRLSMWVARVGRTSFDFAHEVIRLVDGKVVALAVVTVVALDNERRPKPIDPKAKDLVITGRLPAVEAPTRARPDVFWRHSAGLRPSDHDLQQHVNQSRYADLFDDARTLCHEAGGYGPGNWNGPMRRLAIHYEREAVFTDSVQVSTWRVSGSDYDIEFELTNDSDAVLARARASLAG